MVKRVSCILKIDLILPIRTKEYGSMGCGVFKQGIKKNWRIFCLRIKVPNGNYSILSFGLKVSYQKVPKFDSIFYVKNDPSLSQCFFI